MVRPKKPRFIDGIALADNLYPDNKGRQGHYRYLRPDGTFKHFNADTLAKANDLAEKANSNRSAADKHKKPRKGLTMLGGYIEEYIEYREYTSPTISAKTSWRNRCYQMRQFGRVIELSFSKLTRAHIDDWWRTMTHHQQKARHAEFRKLFNYLMGRNVLPRLDYNPFTTADDRPRLYVHASPARKRQRLNIEDFWAIYQSAGRLNFVGLQIAMGVSLTTFMRQEDILTLRIDQHLDGDLLKRVIGKSLAKRGNTKACRLQWDVGNYELLKQLIKRGRELSLKNARCPFLVSHWPKQKRSGVTKIHCAQVTPKRLQTMFNLARDATKRFVSLSELQSPPTFHEIRSLADKLAAQAGYDIEKIQHAMAHSDKSQSLMYLANHELPFEDVAVTFDSKMIGGDFSR